MLSRHRPLYGGHLLTVAGRQPWPCRWCRVMTLQHAQKLSSAMKWGQNHSVSCRYCLRWLISFRFLHGISSYTQSISGLLSFSVSVKCALSLTRMLTYIYILSLTHTPRGRWPVPSIPVYLILKIDNFLYIYFSLSILYYLCTLVSWLLLLCYFSSLAVFSYTLMSRG